MLSQVQVPMAVRFIYEHLRDENEKGSKNNMGMNGGGGNNMNGNNMGMMQGGNMGMMQPNPF